MRLRLLSWNVHKCIGGIDRRYRPERIVELLRHYQPDFALLQEVDNEAPRSKWHRQVDLLGDELGLRHRTFFANVRLRAGGEYGNAILSRFPLRETVNVDLTIPPKKRRGAVHARFRVRGPRRSRTVHVWNLHLGLSGIERKMQLARFLKSHPFAGLHQRTPILVGGDFNDVYGTLGRKLLVPAGFRGPSTPIATFPAWAPLRALDALYVRGDVEIVREEASRLDLAMRASDHRPLVIDLELK